MPVATEVEEKRYIGQVIPPDPEWEDPDAEDYIVTAVDVADDVLAAAAKAAFVSQEVYDSPLTKAGKPRRALGYGREPKQPAVVRVAGAVAAFTEPCGVVVDGQVPHRFQHCRNLLVRKDYDPEVHEAIVTLLKAAHESLGALIEEVAS